MLLPCFFGDRGPEAGCHLAVQGLAVLHSQLGLACLQGIEIVMETFITEKEACS